MADIWFEITNGKFKGFDFHIANPIKGGDTQGVTNVQVQKRRRVQVIKRPFVDGARTKDLGADPRQITLDIIFFGPNYLTRLKDFERVLDEGTSGELILPDDPEAINATFVSMDKTSRANETRSKTVRVTFIEDQVVLATDQAVGAAEGFLPKGLVSIGNDLNDAVSTANEVLENNSLIATVRQIESLTGNASNAFINAVGLTDQVRGRVLTTVANLQNSFNTIIRAKDQLLAQFGVSDSRGSGFTGGVIDEDTGNTVQSLSGDTPEPSEVDPLAVPDTQPDSEVELSSTETSDDLNSFRDQMITFLEGQTEQLAADSDGRTDDVSDSTTGVINLLRDLIAATTPTDPRLVQTPVDMSLAEVLFYNGIPLENINDVYRQNTFIEDIMDIPRGTVIEL